MKTGIALLVVAVGCFSAQHQAKITAGSAIYVDSAHGFDKLLTAAFEARHVPLRIVSSRDKADYELDSAVVAIWDVVETRGPVMDNMTGRTSEPVLRLRSKSGDVVWMYEIQRRVLKRGGQSVADAFAKHIKDVVGQSPKP